MEIRPSNDILNFFKSKNKFVLSFAGFGELGYQDIPFVEGLIKDILLDLKPDEVMINCGTLLRIGGEEGIAVVYRLAKEQGFETCGIHPSISLKSVDTHPVSPFSDSAYFVQDESWGGYLNEERELSPTLKLLLQVTDELIVIGGGKHTADELEAFLSHGKCVNYFAAQMNHRIAKDWCKKSGVKIADLNGAAYEIWRNRRKKDHKTPLPLFSK